MESKEQQYLLDLVSGIVNYPEEITIEKTVDEMGVLLTLKVNSADMGVLIGREGNTIKAIRTLVRIIGMKNQQRINIKVFDPRAKSVSSHHVDSSYEEAKNL